MVVPPRAHPEGQPADQPEDQPEAQPADHREDQPGGHHAQFGAQPAEQPAQWHDPRYTQMLWMGLRTKAAYLPGC